MESHIGVPNLKVAQVAAEASVVGEFVTTGDGAPAAVELRSLKRAGNRSEEALP